MDATNQWSMLSKAIALASSVHEHDLDKGGKSYILHPIRIMMRLRTNDPELMQIAILHDTIEDHPTRISVDILKRLEFSDRVLAALVLLTHSPSDDYQTYIKCMSTNLDCIKVKLEDLRDNSDITRLKGVSKKDIERTEKYHKAFIFLTEKKQGFINE